MGDTWTSKSSLVIDGGSLLMTTLVGAAFFSFLVLLDSEPDFTAVMAVMANELKSATYWNSESFNKDELNLFNKTD